ncbi:hypothetical protein BLNAU_21603 [Blattamonas nauphoetae]|uniref:Right handed beta helix domain-containing protein n=1 Tax=Blattamonas nauphoetae TaxID=2049346 RepID=A0ABQ9WXP0_9EUKA|nr:hypothetical protein BLNAU_21603 [Blattamonas nauphoetae]
MRGGGLSLSSKQRLTLSSCRFSECSVTKPTSEGGGLEHYEYSESGEQVVSNLIFEGCACGGKGGGLYFRCNKGTSLVDIQFINCHTTELTSSSQGGGLYAVGSSDYLELIGCEFVNCSSPAAGGALCFSSFLNFSMEDCVVKGCSSGTGAVMMIWYASEPLPVSFTRVQFIENRVGNSRIFFNTPLKENAGDDYISSSIPSISHQVLIRLYSVP